MAAASIPSANGPLVRPLRHRGERSAYTSLAIPRSRSLRFSLPHPFVVSRAARALFPLRPQPGNVSLEAHDPELYDLVEREKGRQFRSLELIASEVSPPIAEPGSSPRPTGPQFCGWRRRLFRASGACAVARHGR